MSKNTPSESTLLPVVEKAQALVRVTQPYFSLDEYLQSIHQPCGSFRVPLQIREKFYVQAAEAMAKNPLFKGIKLLVDDEIPLNWQVLLRYLHINHIISEPRFSYSPNRNDYPPHYGVYLKSVPFKTSAQAASASSVMAYGRGERIEDAFVRCVGELLERFYLTHISKRNVLFATPSDIAKRYPQTKHFFSHNQYLEWQIRENPDLAFEEKKKIAWILAKEQISKKTVPVPVQYLIRGGLKERTAKEPILYDHTTSGGACASTPEAAMLAGLCELVERDSFMIFWLNTISPPQIELQSIKIPKVQDEIAKVKSYGLEVHFLDTTTDVGIPSCTCVVVDKRNPDVGIMVGSRAGFSEESLFLSSLFEALAGSRSLYAQDPTVVPADYVPFSSQFNLDRDFRLRFWRGEEMYSKFEFFINGTMLPYSKSKLAHVKAVQSLEISEWEYVKRCFNKMGEGYEIYTHFVEDRILKKINAHVCKVYVPALFPLYLREYRATLKSKRLSEVPGRLGYSSTVLNINPHPFP